MENCPRMQFDLFLYFSVRPSLEDVNSHFFFRLIYVEGSNTLNNDESEMDLLPLTRIFFSSQAMGDGSDCRADDSNADEKRIEKRFFVCPFGREASCVVQMQAMPMSIQCPRVYV